MNGYELMAIILLPLAAGAGVFFLKKPDQNVMKLVIAFSGGFLLSICVSHLFPIVYHSEKEHVAIFIMLGFILQIFLDQLSGGAEHGHVHVHEKGSTAWVILAGLVLHSLLEGIPLGNEDILLHDHGHGHGHASDHQNLFAAVILHKIPAAITLAAILKAVNKPPMAALGMLAIFVMATPAGSAIAWLFDVHFLAQYSDYLIALVIGLFLHLATTILFETEAANHKVQLKKIIFIILGMATSYLINL